PSALLYISLFCLLLRRPPTSTLFPYTTLFRYCLRGRPVHPLTAVYLDAAPALRPIVPADDLAPPFLVQVRVIPSLRGRREVDRWQAVRGAFALGFATRMLRGARIAVIDDVMTTGATLTECARVLCA